MVIVAGSVEMLFPTKMRVLRFGNLVSGSGMVSS
jgi:hypothetical protein